MNGTECHFQRHLLMQRNASQSTIRLLNWMDFAHSAFFKKKKRITYDWSSHLIRIKCVTISSKHYILSLDPIDFWWFSGNLRVKSISAAYEIHCYTFCPNGINLVKLGYWRNPMWKMRRSSNNKNYYYQQMAMYWKKMCINSLSVQTNRRFTSFCSAFLHDLNRCQMNYNFNISVSNLPMHFDLIENQDRVLNDQSVSAILQSNRFDSIYAITLNSLLSVRTQTVRFIFIRSL